MRRTDGPREVGSHSAGLELWTTSACRSGASAPCGSEKSAMVKPSATDRRPCSIFQNRTIAAVDTERDVWLPRFVMCSSSREATAETGKVGSPSGSSGASLSRMTSSMVSWTTRLSEPKRSCGYPSFCRSSRFSVIDAEAGSGWGVFARHGAVTDGRWAQSLLDDHEAVGRGQDQSEDSHRAERPASAVFLGDHIADRDAQHGSERFPRHEGPGERAGALLAFAITIRTARLVKARG